LCRGHPTGRRTEGCRRLSRIIIGGATSVGWLFAQLLRPLVVDIVASGP
jgi:hypothetical protein